MAMLGIASANNFFRLRFSSSRTFSQRASETSSPPYFDFHWKNVAPLIPCLRQTSAVFDPVHYSCRISMICSSLNREPFILRLLRGDGLSTQIWRRFRGSGQGAWLFILRPDQQTGSFTSKCSVWHRPYRPASDRAPN